MFWARERHSSFNFIVFDMDVVVLFFFFCVYHTWFLCYSLILNVLPSLIRFSGIFFLLPQYSCCSMHTHTHTLVVKKRLKTAKRAHMNVMFQLSQDSITFYSVVSSLTRCCLIHSPCALFRWYSKLSESDTAHSRTFFLSLCSKNEIRVHRIYVFDCIHSILANANSRNLWCFQSLLRQLLSSNCHIWLYQ